MTDEFHSRSRTDPRPEVMRAWVVAPDRGHRALYLVDRRVPTPENDEVLVRTEACGVCRTDLHLADGDLAPRAPAVTPGHEVVGTVVGRGSGAKRFDFGDRVGIAWLAGTCGRCRACRSGQENLCHDSEYTGWDRHGGYAEYVTVREAFAYRLPATAPAGQLAPLLCSGIIGYRALQRARVPAGGRLGIYGFGASAHLTAQLAIRQGLEVHVLTRGKNARRLALELGAASAGPADAMPPVPLDGSIMFAPAGELVPPALAGLAQGGTLAIAGIHLSDIPTLNYQHHLFRERTLTSVTSNTRSDGETFLRLAGATGITASVTSYRFSDADRALRDLASGALTGAAVLQV